MPLTQISSTEQHPKLIDTMEDGMFIRYLTLVNPVTYHTTTDMPKATSQKLSRQHAPPVAAASSRPGKGKAGAAGGEEGGAAASGGGGKNHLFDTAKFGQHILMNPLVAQG